MGRGCKLCERDRAARIARCEGAERSEKVAEISKLMDELADLQANPALRKVPDTSSSPVEGNWSADDVFSCIVVRYDALVAFQEEHAAKLKEIEDKLKEIEDKWKELRDLLIRQDRGAYNVARRRYKEDHPL